MQTDEKINKQCSKYMYLSNFEAGAFFGRKSAHVRSLSFECACIGTAEISSHIHSFRDEAGAICLMKCYSLWS